MTMNLRKANSSESPHIQKLCVQAFTGVEGKSVAQLAGRLMEEVSTPRSLHLVAEIHQDVIGYVAFSPVKLKSQQKLIGYILAPLAVEPRYHGKGIGSHLVKRGIDLLLLQDISLLFVYGDPGYYGRFGFDASPAEKFIPPFKLKYPFGWQALNLLKNPIETKHEMIECVEALHDPKLW